MTIHISIAPQGDLTVDGLYGGFTDRLATKNKS